METERCLAEINGSWISETTTRHAWVASFCWLKSQEFPGDPSWFGQSPGLFRLKPPRSLPISVDFLWPGDIEIPDSSSIDYPYTNQILPFFGRLKCPFKTGSFPDFSAACFPFSIAWVSSCSKASSQEIPNISPSGSV